MIDELLAPFGPSESALTALFRAEIDEDMLREIAEADYGEMADKCDALLQPILHDDLVVSGDPYLREVLELTRWLEPGDLDEKPVWLRAHWKRLFACTLLMRLEPEYPTWCGSECDTMAQLISSAIQLGVGVARAAASVLSARFIRDPGDEDDPPFLAFAILLLATYAECGVGEDRGPLLKQLATRVESEESRARTERSEPEWLFGLNRYTGRERVWRSLAERILMHPERPHPREANSALRRLAEFAAGRQDRAETETQ